MARLKKEHKTFIVRSLARYASQREVINAVKDKFGLSISHSQVSMYHPEASSSRTLGQDLRELFYRERDSFLNDVSDLPYSNKGYRIRKMCEAATEAEAIMLMATTSDEKLSAIRTFTDSLVKIDRMMEPGRESRPDNDDGIRPTIQQINNLIYFDK